MYKAVEWENNKKKARGELLNNKFAEIENFTASKQINSFDGFYIFAIDESNEKIAYVTELDKTIIEFANIIGVELIEDGNTVSKKSTSKEEVYKSIFKEVFNKDLDDKFTIKKDWKPLFNSLWKDFDKVEWWNKKWFSQIKLSKDELIKRINDNFEKSERIEKSFDELDLEIELEED